MRYRVRFHLGRGENFMKWQIKDTETKEVVYACPQTESLKLLGCKLRNRKRTAMKIFEGDDKTVCAWIECDIYEINLKETPLDRIVELNYNPRRCVHWTDSFGRLDLDETHHAEIVTIGKRTFKVI